MRSAHRVRLLAVVLAVAVGPALAGCATTSALPGHHATRACGGTEDQDGPAAPAAQLAVVCRWSAALRAGDIQAAAGYFRLPSLFEDGPGDVATIHLRSQAVLANESLSCGAEVISAFRQGRFINVLFRLTSRAGAGGAAACGSGVGDSARTAFLIRDGRIEVWLRTASRPGDPGGPSTTSTTGGTLE